MYFPHHGSAAVVAVFTRDLLRLRFPGLAGRIHASIFVVLDVRRDAWPDGEIPMQIYIPIPDLRSFINNEPFPPFDTLQNPTVGSPKWRLKKLRVENIRRGMTWTPDLQETLRPFVHNDTKLIAARLDAWQNIPFRLV